MTMPSFKQDGIFFTTVRKSPANKIVVGLSSFLIA